MKKSKILYYMSDLILGDKASMLTKALANFLKQAPTMLVITDAKGKVLAYVPLEAKDKMLELLDGKPPAQPPIYAE